MYISYSIVYILKKKRGRLVVIGRVPGVAAGKAPSKLRIYDPFYCAGAVVKHLGELGFPHVYNKCEDDGVLICGMVR